MLFSVCALILWMPIISASKAVWSYENMQKWPRSSRYCAGHLQSPIALQFNISHYDQRLRPIFLEDRQSKERMHLVNNGHTAQLSLSGSYVLRQVAPESEDYVAEQVHFHWGQVHNNENGSEHTLNGRSYPLEMHVVTYSNMFSSISDAMSNVRGLAVVGVFFELSNEANPLLQPLIDALGQIQRQGDRVTVRDEFSVKALIGEERMQRYYRYDGSLTTPPCYESVLWTVLQDPIKLSFDQLHAFKYLHDDSAKPMENTYRKVQALGTRKLFRSFRFEDIQDELKEKETLSKNAARSISMDMGLSLLLASLLMISF